MFGCSPVLKFKSTSVAVDVVVVCNLLARLDSRIWMPHCIHRKVIRGANLGRSEKSEEKSRFFQNFGKSPANCLEWFRNAKLALMTLLPEYWPREHRKNAIWECIMYIYVWERNSMHLEKCNLNIVCSKTLQCPYFSCVLTYRTHNDVKISRYIYRQSFTWPTQVNDIWTERVGDNVW